MRRGRPQRSPYSTQAKFGTSGGSLGRPCGGGSTPRGIGRSNGQYSMFMARLTMIGLPRNGASLGRSRDSANGTRGLDHIALTVVSATGHLLRQEGSHLREGDQQEIGRATCRERGCQYV